MDISLQGGSYIHVFIGGSWSNLTSFYSGNLNLCQIFGRMYNHYSVRGPYTCMTYAIISKQTIFFYNLLYEKNIKVNRIHTVLETWFMQSFETKYINECCRSCSRDNNHAFFVAGQNQFSLTRFIVTFTCKHPKQVYAYKRHLYITITMEKSSIIKKKVQKNR